MREPAFRQDYASLPDDFWRDVSPNGASAPKWLAYNQTLGGQLGIDADFVETDAGLALFAGNQFPAGCRPIATAYAGHQFGQFVPQLGDGRALLLGELSSTDGLKEVQLKGAGITPFSRGGDGRAPLGPVIREYLLSEAMYALGVPTTRALAAVFTGERVYREEVLPGAILTRVASSHIRVGTFQYFAARGEWENSKALADFVIERHYPDAKTEANPYLALLARVIDKQLSLVAKWMSVGFIHGVMNTDNTSIAGETIDYGPCAFMDEFNHNKVFSSIDRQGRYAYGNQPAMIGWNMARFAETLLPLLADNQQEAIRLATELLETMMDRFQGYWLKAMAPKIGIAEPTEEDRQLLKDLLDMMEANEADFTEAFVVLRDLLLSDNLTAPGLDLMAEPQAQKWCTKWRERLKKGNVSTQEAATLMQHTNPLIIPRNHRVESVINAALEGDLQPFYRLSNALSQPFNVKEKDRSWLASPNQQERVTKTFCGT